MKIILSHDGLSAINLEQVNSFYIEVSDTSALGTLDKRVMLWADDQIISTYDTLDRAKNELNSIINMACTQENFVYPT